MAQGHLKKDCPVPFCRYSFRNYSFILMATIKLVPAIG